MEIKYCIRGEDGKFLQFYFGLMNRTIHLDHAARFPSRESAECVAPKGSLIVMVQVTCQEITGPAVEGPPLWPHLDVNDIAKAVGVRVEHHSGDISSCGSVEIPLRDGRTLLLQCGDSEDHYRVAAVASQGPQGHNPAAVTIT